MSTSVKASRVAKGQATRAALVEAARALFGEHGYGPTSIDDIAERAGVTKGAFYHHYPDKESLFRTVFEQVQQEVSDRAVVEFLQEDSWLALTAGCRLWVEEHLVPEVRRIVLIDARVVLGWEAARAIETRFSTVALRGALRKAMQANVIRRVPLRPLSFMLIGALGEACLYLADSSSPASAHDDVAEVIEGLLSGLRSEAAA